MQDRKIKGTTEWTEYAIELPIAPRADRVVFGALLAGEGTAWVDDLELRVDGKPLAEAPAPGLDALLERPRAAESKL